MTLLRGAGSIRVYRGGVLRQRGFGFFSGLLDVVKKGAKALAPTLLKAGKEIAIKSLPKVGSEVMKMVTGKQNAKQGFKNIFHKALKPAVKDTISEKLNDLVTGIKEPSLKRKRSQRSKPRTLNIKKRKKDIFDNGFSNDAS